MVSGGKSLLDDDDNVDLLNSTALMRMVDDTSLLPRDESLDGIVDLTEATGELPSLDSTAFNKSLAANVDFDLGGEPATMSEVGTKLDLAVPTWTWVIRAPAASSTSLAGRQPDTAPGS
jgi:hypothetical protein